MSIVTWHGKRTNSGSVPSLNKIAELFGEPINVTQGGYNKGGVSASAGTHDGGAVLDISVAGWSSSKRKRFLKIARLCGWAAWLRTPAQGFPYHIHMVRCGDTTASSGAEKQVRDYRNGRNGLASGRADDGPRVGYVTWENSKYNPKNGPQPKPLKNFLLKNFRGAVKTIGYNLGMPSHVAVVQTALKQLGYYDYSIDGIKGAKTKEGLARFLKKWKLPVGSNGNLNLRQLDRVIWEAEKKQAGTQYPTRGEK